MATLRRSAASAALLALLAAPAGAQVLQFQNGIIIQDYAPAAPSNPVAAPTSPYLVSTEPPVRTFLAPRGGIRALAWSVGGKFVATAGTDNTVRVYGLASGAELRRFTGHRSAVSAVVFTPDGKFLISAGLDKAVRLWDLAQGKEVRQFAGHRRPVHALAISPDGKVLASAAADDESAILCDVASGRELGRARGHKGDVYAVAFAPDGKTFATGGLDHTVRLWQTADAKQSRTFDGHTNMVTALAFHPDGRTLASAGQDGAVRLWDVASAGELRTLGNSPGGVKALAFSPDGKTLAAAGGDHVVHLWEPATGQERRQFRGHGGTVWALAFSDDGRLIASGADDRATRVWDATGLVAGTELRPTRLSAKELDGFWDDLAAADAARAYRAVWTLAEGGASVVPFIRDHLPRAGEVSVADARRIAELIRDLDDDRFTAREKATDELEQIGRPAEPALRRALEASHYSAEVALRVSYLLESLKAPTLPPDQVRALRALEVLERIGSAEARGLLESLGQGPSAARLTREAKAALERLTRRGNVAAREPAGRETGGSD